LHGRLGLQWGAGEMADGSVWAFDVRYISGGDAWQVQPPERLVKPIVNLMWAEPWILARCTDGTLWRWSDAEFHSSGGDWVRAFNAVAPRRASGRTDWVALSPRGLALTADGVLWGWPDDSSRWLGPSRRLVPLSRLPEHSAQ
jgi:hypothetical protein